MPRKPSEGISHARRRLLAAAAVATAGAATRAWGRTVDLRLPGGPSARPLTTAYPEKGAMILQRERPPLLETPFEVFDQGVFTPNDRFFVRWHWPFPTAVDLATFKLNVRGHVGRPLSLSMADLLAMPRVELAAVNQCAGNSRGLFTPRVTGAQWRHGAMGNALWTGVSLRHVLDRAGVRAGASAVRFTGAEGAIGDDALRFAKSLAVDHARDGEVMLAFAMNGEQLPLLNGFPVRLVAPGWYSTYWVKMLNDIEVLTGLDEGYWMARAYRIPAAPGANVAPDATGYPTAPISRMAPRSWITNFADEATAPFAPEIPLRGIAMGGDAGVARVEVSTDGGATWAEARLGPDAGKYGFRRFEATLRPARAARLAVMTRCVNAAGAVQPLAPNWNPSGYMRGCVETTTLVIR